MRALLRDGPANGSVINVDESVEVIEIPFRGPALPDGAMGPSAAGVAAVRSIARYRRSGATEEGIRVWTFYSVVSNSS